jgi:hypothetical protein
LRLTFLTVKDRPGRVRAIEEAQAIRRAITFAV